MKLKNSLNRFNSKLGTVKKKKKKVRRPDNIQYNYTS